jgi:hypothetical protein
MRSARTHAPALRACVQIAPDRLSVAETPADKRFGNRASDTSKIDFKGVHQTGSTPNLLSPKRIKLAFADQVMLKLWQRELNALIVQGAEKPLIDSNHES